MAETPIRPIRIPEDVWRAAQEKARSEGTSASAVVVDALRRYVRRRK